MNTKDSLYVSFEAGVVDEFGALGEWCDADRSPEGWRLGHAVRMWHGHARAYARPEFDRQRAAYERAIAHAVARLRGITSLEALIRHYFDDRHSSAGRRGRYDGMVPVDPQPGTVERWVAEAVAAAGDDALVRPIVEELAFCRRSEELLARRAA